jgi:hypothetical protein
VKSVDNIVFAGEVRGEEGEGLQMVGEVGGVVVDDGVEGWW